MLFIGKPIGRSLMISSVCIYIYLYIYIYVYVYIYIYINICIWFQWCSAGRGPGGAARIDGWVCVMIGVCVVRCQGAGCGVWVCAGGEKDWPRVQGRLFSRWPTIGAVPARPFACITLVTFGSWQILGFVLWLEFDYFRWPAAEKHSLMMNR